MATRPDLTTDRLWLRPLRTDDAEDLHVAYSDPVCLRHWHHPPTTTVDQTRGWLTNLVDYELGAHWAFGTHGDPTVLGFTGFVNGLEADGHAGFGYLSRRSSWGNGYVAEASRPVLDHGFDEVGIARAELWIQCDNAQSIRVAEKLGCLRRAADGSTLIYGVTAEQWRGEPDPPPVHLSAEPVLGVRDVVAAIKWWVDVLGFREGFTYGDPPTHGAVLAGPGWRGSPRVQLNKQASPTPAAVYVVANDIDAIAARAAAAGATIVEPLRKRPWGREIELADPDGNSITVA